MIHFFTLNVKIHTFDRHSSFFLPEVGGQEDQLSENLGALGHPGQIRGDNEPQDAHQGRERRMHNFMLKDIIRKCIILTYMNMTVP